MSSQLAIEALRQALMMTFWLCVPMLGVLFIVGVLISLIQILTSIQDPSFGAVPRLTAFLAALLLFLPWMLMKIMSYATAVLGDLGRYAH